MDPWLDTPQRARWLCIDMSEDDVIMVVVIGGVWSRRKPQAENKSPASITIQHTSFFGDVYSTGQGR